MITLKLLHNTRPFISVAEADQAQRRAKTQVTEAYFLILSFQRFSHMLMKYLLILFLFLNLF